MIRRLTWYHSILQSSSSLNEVCCYLNGLLIVSRCNQSVTLENMDFDNEIEQISTLQMLKTVLACRLVRLVCSKS